MPRLRPLLVPLVLLMVSVGARGQTLIPGGGPARSDCYGEWASAPATGGTRLDCADGDPVCDLDRTANGACAIAVGVCLHVGNLPRCVPRPVREARVRQMGKHPPIALPVPPPPPVNTSTCGADAVVTLPLRAKRNGRQEPSRRVGLQLTTVVAGTPPKDQDTLKLRCVPNRGEGQCTANPAGGPRELRLVTAGAGTDVDIGWTGTTQSFAVTANAMLRVCLADCGATSSPQCGEREADTAAVNGPTFGAPLPLLAADVPVCVVNRFATPALVGVGANVETGAIAGTMRLVTEFYRTSLTQVCPR